MAQQQANYQPFNPKDFQDPTLFKFNTVFGQLWQKVNDLYGSKQGADLKSTVQAPAFFATKQDQIPTDDTTLITLGTAKKLFGPDAMRTALTTGAHPTGPVQPLPPLGGDTFTVDLTTYTGTLTFAGGRLIKHT